jgi:hypothetical protein
MKFVLEVDLTPLGDNAGRELGRILRYWGGAAPQLPLQPGDSMGLYDSQYRQVGQWTVTGDPPAPS